MQLQGFCMLSISLGEGKYQVSVEDYLYFVVGYGDYLDKKFCYGLFLIEGILTPTVYAVLYFFGG